MSQALESGYSVLENMAGFSSADFPGKNLQGMHRSDAVISVVLVSGLPICPNLQHIQKCWWNCIRWFTLCGTCHDVTWLCEFLACQLFGNGEISSKISAIDPRNQKWITVLHSSELCTYIYIFATGHCPYWSTRGELHTPLTVPGVRRRLNFKKNLLGCPLYPNFPENILDLGLLPLSGLSYSFLGHKPTYPLVS